MENKIKTISEQILQEITPSAIECKKIEALSHKLERNIKEACKTEGVAANVRVEGSVAKDTWLSKNPDIDIFIRLPTSIPRKNLGDIGLKIARKAAGNAKWVERFAEHPYLEIFMDGYPIDIVPCYDAKSGKWQSATDRTPYHTDYIKKNLKAELRGEVRLLKKYLQGIGVYGAEIKVGGFSGYLCELLILRFGSFVEVVKAFATRNKRLVIDIENFYVHIENELDLLFPEPLVVVDPIDKGRNVASAVLPQKLNVLIAASRAFLERPSAQFFNPNASRIFSISELKNNLTSRGSVLVFVIINKLNAVPDILWGQLFRTKRSIKKLLQTNDYTVLRDEVWSNENELSILVLELEQQLLPNIKKHLGPPLERKEECEKFLFKYKNNKQVVSGPYIENGRWIVEIYRRNTDAVALLRENLADGGKNCGVAELVAKALKRNLEILVNEEIIEVYSDIEEFSGFLTEFLIGRPFWLEA